jgi:Ca-activated chloride channel family protein
VKTACYIGFIILLLPSLASAQQYYLKGEVKDETGKLLQNASILQLGTGYVFHSGITGSFGFITGKKIDTLIFSLDGYQKQKKAANAERFTTIILKRAAGVKKSSDFKLASLTKDLQRDIQRNWFASDESYASIIENQFINTSKFSSTALTLNVDRASYSNVRRFLTMKTMVPPDAVRLEEMLNYFNFRYTEPEGNKTFSINTVFTECPWNKNNQLLFANISSKKVPLTSLPPSHLVFLIDISGSMDITNRLPLLKAGFKGLVNNLRAKDSVSIVVYGGTVGIMLNATSGEEKYKIFKAIDSLQPGGSTPGESGIKLAYSVARNHFIKGGNNRVILATDGDFNVGLRSEEELDEMIAEQKKSGIYLTCLGVGMGNYKDSKIQTLAQKGNGNFAYIDNYAEAEKVLLKEFTQTLYTVADDVYLNAKFNNDYVKEYRLIGFDNKVGAISDTTTTIEGGEIGSAYSMLVAFEIVPNGENEMLAENEISLQPIQFIINYKEGKTTKPYELVETPNLFLKKFKDLEKSYQFASAVIMYGSLIKGSNFIKNVDWNDVLLMASSSADLTNPSQKEFVDLVQQAKMLYSKKKKKGVH